MKNLINNIPENLTDLLHVNNLSFYSGKHLSILDPKKLTKMKSLVNRYPAIVAFRTTRENKQIIDKICQEQKLTKSEFIRHMALKIKNKKI